MVTFSPKGLHFVLNNFLKIIRVLFLRFLRDLRQNKVNFFLTFNQSLKYLFLNNPKRCENGLNRYPWNLYKETVEEMGNYKKKYQINFSPRSGLVISLFTKLKRTKPIPCFMFIKLLKILLKSYPMFTYRMNTHWRSFINDVTM